MALIGIEGNGVEERTGETSKADRPYDLLISDILSSRTFEEIPFHPSGLFMCHGRVGCVKFKFDCYLYMLDHIIWENKGTIEYSSGCSCLFLANCVVNW